MRKRSCIVKQIPASITNYACLCLLGKYNAFVSIFNVVSLKGWAMGESEQNAETKGIPPPDPAKGGRARAKKLSPEVRKDIARRAAEARWGSDLPVATHGSEDHPLRIGEIEIPCYVLADGRRVLVQRGMLVGMDMSQGTAGRGPGDRLAKFIAGKAVNPFVPKDLAEMIINPIKFKTTTGNIAYGYEATVLADLCDAVLEARKTGKLNYQTEHIAARCEILVRGFARVGIIALVDEATGYQYDRARMALEEILERFIAKELAKWNRTFEDDFYLEMFRLRGWQFREDAIKRKLRPMIVGRITRDIVYERLAPGVLTELERLNPKDDRGRRKHKLFQRLTEDFGHPRLKEHLKAVTVLMRSFDGWGDFYRALNRSLPKQVQMPLFDRDDEASEEEAAAN